MTCEGCIHRHIRIVGQIEYAGDYHDRRRPECRLFPPTVGFFGASFPPATTRCGQYQSEDTND